MFRNTPVMRLAGLMLLTCITLILPGRAQAQQDVFQDPPAVMIDITGGQGRKYVIAIPNLISIAPGDSVDEKAAYLPDRLSANLTMTGLFHSLDKRSFLETNPRAGVDESLPMEFPAWNMIGTDFVVKGAMSLSGSRLTLEMRLYDVARGSKMLGKRYTGSVGDARKMINQFTNAVLEAITGIPGVFGSEIIFVTGDRSQRSIMLTELGSDEATNLAGFKGGPSSQPTMGSGGQTAWIHRNGAKYELLVNGKVVSSGPTHTSPAIRPDGLVAAAVSGPYSTNIMLFDGKKQTALTKTSGIALSPTFSPDGSQMAYVSDQSGTLQVYVTSAGGGTGQRLTPNGKNSDPAWSPTGEWIAFVTGETDICIVRPDGSGLRQLTSGQGINLRPSFSPDGRMIVFSSTRYGRPQLFVMAANGDSQQPLLPGYQETQYTPYWCPTMPDQD